MHTRAHLLVPARTAWAASGSTPSGCLARSGGGPKYPRISCCHPPLPPTHYLSLPLVPPLASHPLFQLSNTQTPCERPCRAGAVVAWGPPFQYVDQDAHPHMDSTTRHAGLAVAFAAVLVASLAAPAPVAAQSAETETDVPDELFDSEADGSTPDVVRGLLAGIRERVSLTLGSIGADTSADAVAADATQAFNDRAGDFETYANSRTTASTNYNVLAITFVQDGDEAVRYVVADINGSEYRTPQMVGSTDRSVDEECTIEDGAARNADTEIERFHDRFVEGNETVTRQYMSRMASTYGDPIGDQDVSCTFMEG